jgi:hypothetical protein
VSHHQSCKSWGYAACNCTSWTVAAPIKTTNPLNGAHGHWIVRSKARKAQRDGIRLFLQAHYGKQPWRVTFPVEIMLVRVAPSNGLDDDSLPASMKSIRDGITDWLGLKDDRTPDIVWRYGQRRGARGVYHVEVTMRSAT